MKANEISYEHNHLRTQAALKAAALMNGVGLPFPKPVSAERWHAAYFAHCG